jgi:branched-chain amino acid transport system substrate-binding protein
MMLEKEVITYHLLASCVLPLPLMLAHYWDKLSKEKKMSGISKKNLCTSIMAVLIILSFMLTGCAQSTPQAVATTAPSQATSQPSSPVPSGDVRVAFMGPLTGPAAADAILATNGAQLAVDQRNAAGGICGGRKIKLETYDDKADPKEAANVATKLVEDAGMLTVLHGWNSSAVLAAAPIFNQAGLVQMDYYGIAPAIADAGPYTFRVIPTGVLMAKFMATWMVKDDGLKKIAVVYENTDYGKSVFDVFSPEVKSLGGEVVASEAYLIDQKDFSSIIAKFKAASPDAVMLFGQYDAAAYWVKQAPDIGFSAPVYGGDGVFAPDLIKLAGKNAEGMKSLSSWAIDSTDPYVSAFVSAFRKSFSTDPNIAAGYVYDAMILSLNALDAGNCTRDGAKTWLTTNVKDVQGVTGLISFENRDRKFQQGLYIKMVVKDGNFVQIAK